MWLSVDKWYQLDPKIIDFVNNYSKLPFPARAKLENRPINPKIIQAKSVTKHDNGLKSFRATYRRAWTCCSRPSPTPTAALRLSAATLATWRRSCGTTWSPFYLPLPPSAQQCCRRQQCCGVKGGWVLASFIGRLQQALRHGLQSLLKTVPRWFPNGPASPCAF